jgi:glyoxylase-like metal-dependent hydrolase (beta-lactamase superfamily II)
MRVETSMNEQFLSNTYLVSDEAGGGFFVDAGGPVEPLIAAAERDGITPTQLTGRWPGLEVLISPDEPAVEGTTGELTPGDVEVGALTVRALPTPGHTKGMISLLVDDEVFTGDTLFKNSVGGVRAPGHTTFGDIKHSIMDVLLALPGDTVIRPGHTDATTVADELEHNSFVRIWRGLDPEGSEPCTAMGEQATLVHLGDDYDGGHKAWVRWPDGTDDIVPGSQVSRS